MHRFRLVYKLQLNNLNFERYWLVDLNFRAPDWSKFKLLGQIYCRFRRNRNLCSTLVQTTLEKLGGDDFSTLPSSCTQGKIEAVSIEILLWLPVDLALRNFDSM